AVTVAGGERRVLAARALQPGQRRWVDWRVDLSAFGGQNVELELSTQARPGEDGKPPPAAPAFWGSPVVLAPAAASLPFNIVFFVVDALRGDAVAGLHDPKLDAQMARAPHPPLDAWLPKLEGLTPNLDALAGRGVSFARASSASTWTRPGTIAMLTGARSGSLGLSPREMIPSIKEVQQFYALKPPFLPRLLRTRGAVTRAFVNNFYLVGYAGVGVDIGFEGMIDHRHPTNDTEWITQDTLTWLRENKNQRFALFVNYGSPHSPYEPPAADLQAVPPSPVGPSNATVRAYLGEIHKDDTAIGRVVAELDALGLREDTLVIVTADHGETLSVEHESIPLGLMRDPPSGRFHHLLCIWDETVRVPIILSYPKRLPQGVLITEPVQTTDIVPTVIDLAQMERPAATQGRSLVPLAQGKPAVAQPIIVEGRGAWAIRDGRYRLIVRERAYQRLRTIHGERTVALELYDLENDPGERDEISSAHPDIVQRLKSKLESHLNAQARRDQPISSSQSGAHPIIRLRFVTAGTRHRASGSLEASPPPGEHRAVLKARGVRLDARALRERGGGWDFDFSTEPDRSVGFDLEVDPPTADVKWRLLVDGRPWPAERVYAGSFGLRAETLAGGVVGEPMRTIAAAELTPLVDPKRDWGLFVTRDSIAHEVELTREGASQETLRLMHAWGYAADEVESDDAAAPAPR
ncbi:MAG TPA: sulfatase, partial [Polyangiaceae bacterium]